MARPAIYSFGFLCLLTAACGGRQQPASRQEPPAAAAGSGGYEVIAVTDGGSIAGTISLSGPIPELPPRPINKDPQVCGTGTRRSQQLMVSLSGGLKNAIVLVEGVRRGKAMPAIHAQINQSGCEYDPHVQVMPLDADITIVNSDPVLHNIHFWLGDGDLFNIAQPIKGQTNTHKIEKAGIMYAECDVHGWMKGHVAVVDNPYYAVTDDSGQFSIGDLPAGAYTVRIWHEYLGQHTQSVNVSSKVQTPLNVDLKDLLAKKVSALTPTAAPATTSGPPEGGRHQSASDHPLASDFSRTPARSTNVLSGEVTVKMVSEGGSFRYEPNSITVRAGTTVKWANESDNRHSATDDPKFEKAAGMAILPAKGEPWTTPFVGNGETASHTFTEPGTYQYFCRNHGQFGMVGTITVVQ